MKTLPLFQENKIMPELKEETLKDFAPANSETTIKPQDNSLAELIDKFENDYSLEDDLKERYPFKQNEMIELGFMNFSDRKYKRRINL